MKREHEESSSVRDKQKLAELKLMIARRKKLVARMLNGDEEEFPTPPPKRPHLRIVK